MNNYKTYEVRVYTNGDKHWYLNGKYHREDGPAIEKAGGPNEWWLMGKWLTEKEFNRRTKKTCNNKVVEIDGIKYRLQLIEE